MKWLIEFLTSLMVACCLVLGILFIIAAAWRVLYFFYS